MVAAKFGDLDLLAEFCGSVIVVSGFLFIILKTKFVPRDEFIKTMEFNANKSEKLLGQFEEYKMLFVRHQETHKSLQEDVLELKDLNKEYGKIAQSLKEMVAQLTVQVKHNKRQSK